MKTLKAFLLLLLLCALSPAVSELQGNQGDPDRNRDRDRVQSCDLQTLLRELSVKVAVLQTNLDNLQRQNQEQAEKLKEVEALKFQQHDQGCRLTQVEKQSSQVELKQQDQASELQTLKSRSNQTELLLDSVRREQEVGKVAFTVSLRTSGEGAHGPVSDFTPLVFRNVITNVGNAYNRNTGEFIPPVRGVYHFELYIAGVGSGHHLGARILKNGHHVVVASQLGTQGWGGVSNAATLQLELNDVVSVDLHKNDRIFESPNRHNTFSGRLLFTV